MVYQMAAYCRLSKDDREKRVSESIENQMKLIREYVDRAGDMEIADVYMDDGYSGLYFANRPEFQRMMGDIYKGKIQGVITKDISRLGREHIETSNYMERVFPALNIRYIAILDGVDSMSHSNEELAQFKTLFNDMYSRDISKKIKGSLTVQKKRGQFMSGFAPYGYVKDPEDKHRFLVDREAAAVIRRIYSLYLEGYSGESIARKLNQDGILPPSEYKRKVQGLSYFNGREKPEGKGWAYPTVRAILRNRVYTGAMVQHKSEKISYKMEKCRRIPEEEQYIVENMHEPIISREMFEQVQAIGKRRVRTPGFQGEARKAHPYAGILVCGDCGHLLQRVSCRDGYECGSYHRKGNAACGSHFVKKEVLDEMVRSQVEGQVKTVLEGGQWDEYFRMAGGRRGQEKSCKEDRMKDRMKDRMEDRMEDWIEHWMEDGRLGEVTREIIVKWIDRIVVNGDMSMDIEWNDLWHRWWHHRHHRE